MSEERLHQGTRDRVAGLVFSLSNHIPILVPARSSQQRVDRFNRWADRRNVRRVLAALVVFALAVEFTSWYLVAYGHQGHSLGLHTLSHRVTLFIVGASGLFQVGLVLISSRMVYMLAGSSEDGSLSEFWRQYDRLTPQQRKQSLQRYRAEFVLRCFRPDERQAVQHDRAQQSAYRFLRKTLVVLAVVSWIAYLTMPELAFASLLKYGEILVDNPLALSWLVLALFALPTLIRLWTEPDVLREPSVLITQEHS